MILEALNITVDRGGREILHNVTLRLEPGRLTALIGPNGSGKSTLLKALAGIWPVKQGKVEPLDKLPRRTIAQKIAFVPQDTHIDFAFSVWEIVAMGRHPHRGRFTPESSKDKQAIATAIERCDISHLRTRQANSLSGGERQRVLIARSLAAEPAVILLDEPTASLDIEHAIGILDLSRQLAREGQTVAIAIHDLNAVAKYADVAALLDQGKITSQGSTSHVLTPQAFEETFGVQAEILTAADGSRHYNFHRIPGRANLIPPTK